MESSETISMSPNARATATATADLPDAVGPTRARCSTVGCSRFSRR
jgi:hypothetical protein